MKKIRGLLTTGERIMQFTSNTYKVQRIDVSGSKLEAQGIKSAQSKD